MTGARKRRSSGSAKRAGRLRASARRRKSRRAVTRWSARVTEHSNALDLEPAIFTATDPRRIARSLKRSARSSTRRKGSAYQSAMSMLNFYINRAGGNLSQRQRKVLERAKVELRSTFNRR